MTRRRPRRRTTAAADPSSLPPNLWRTIAWALGTAGGVSVLWVAIITIMDHNTKAAADHDSKFVQKDQMEKHEREDVQSINQLTGVVNQLASNAEMGRQWLLASNKDIKASVADLALTICRRDNPKDTSNACQQQQTTLNRAIQEATSQAQIANDVTNKTQAIKVPSTTPTNGR